MLLYNKYNNSNFNEICIYLYENGANDIDINDIIKTINVITKYYVSETINNLINISNDISKNDFLLLCTHNIIIKNIKIIKKYLDDVEIQKVIFNNNLNYPININYTIEILRNECKKKNNIIAIIFFSMVFCTFGLLSGC